MSRLDWSDTNCVMNHSRSISDLATVANRIAKGDVSKTEDLAWSLIVMARDLLDGTNPTQSALQYVVEQLSAKIVPPMSSDEAAALLVDILFPSTAR